MPCCGAGTPALCCPSLASPSSDVTFVQGSQFCYFLYFDTSSAFFSISFDHSPEGCSTTIRQTATQPFYSSNTSTVPCIPAYGSSNATFVDQEYWITNFNQLLPKSNNEQEALGPVVNLSVVVRSVEESALLIHGEERTIAFEPTTCVYDLEVPLCPQHTAIDSAGDASSSFQSVSFQPSVPWWEPTVTTAWRIGFSKPSTCIPLSSTLLSNLVPGNRDADCAASCHLNLTDSVSTCDDLVAHVARTVGCYVNLGVDPRQSVVMTLCDQLRSGAAYDNTCASVTKPVCNLINTIGGLASTNDLSVQFVCLQNGGVALVPCADDDNSDVKLFPLLTAAWVYGHGNDIMLECTKCQFYLAPSVTADPYLFAVLGAIVNSLLLLLVSTVIDQWFGEKITRAYVSMILVFLPFRGHERDQQKEELVRRLRPCVISKSELMVDLVDACPESATFQELRDFYMDKVTMGGSRRIVRGDRLQAASAAKDEPTEDTPGERNLRILSSICALFQGHTNTIELSQGFLTIVAPPQPQHAVAINHSINSRTKPEAAACQSSIREFDSAETTYLLRPLHSPRVNSPMPTQKPRIYTVKELLEQLTFEPIELTHDEVSRKVLCPKYWWLLSQLLLSCAYLVYVVLDSSKTAKAALISSWDTYQIVFFRMLNSSLPLTSLINVALRINFDKRGAKTSFMFVGCLLLVAPFATHVLPMAVLFAPISALFALLAYGTWMVFRSALNCMQESHTLSESRMLNVAIHIGFRTVCTALVIMYCQSMYNYGVLLYSTFPLSSYFDIIRVEAESRANVGCTLHVVQSDVSNILQLFVGTFSG